MITKQEYAEKFGRWIKEDEIVIEDLTETQLLDLGEKLGDVGYRLEYWKSPKQKSGHLHLKDIQFEKCPKPLTHEQILEYKKLWMKANIPQHLHKQVDWAFVNAKRHRIATENEEHYKGYGIKELIKVFGEDNPNRVERDLYFKAKNIEPPKEYVVNPNAPKIQERIKITDLAKALGLKLHGNKAVCPFHNDTDPSLIFNDEKGAFYCFGCFAKGGIIKFVQMMEDLKNG
jgi:hypothetical protein